MNTNLNDYKERAKNLRKAVSSVLKIECTQSQAYELIAKEENYPNWDALSGSINKNEIENQPLSTKEQIAQLYFFHEGVRGQYTLDTILSILKEQKNPIIKKGWSNVKWPFEGNNYSVIFAKTNLFSDDVLTIFKMSFVAGSFESAVKSAIDFLKLVND